MTDAGIMSFAAKSFCDRPFAFLACERASRSSIDGLANFMGPSSSSFSSWRMSTPAAVLCDVPPFGAPPFAAPPLLTKTK